VCIGDEECGTQDGDRFVGPTDRDGCDINAFRMGEQNFYGPGSQFKVNTEKPFKVVTRFHAPDGVLEEIEQLYVQDGEEIHHPSYSAGGNKNTESDDFCSAQKTTFGDRNSFSEHGGMKTMGEALDRGMVLVISMWDDIAVSMNWLDSYMDCDPSEPGCTRGPCDPADGLPETLRKKSPESSYIVDNLRWGEFGTTMGPPAPAPAPSPSPAPSSGKCCWGGDSCSANMDCHQDPYCGANEGQCTGNCAGVWCGSVEV